LIDENQIRFSALAFSCLYFGLLNFDQKHSSKFIYHSLSYPLPNSRMQRLIQMYFTNFQCLLMDKTIFQSKDALEHWRGNWMLRNTAIVPVGFDKKTLYSVSEGHANEDAPIIGFS
jgi:hypothetical protein